ncbi:MAG: hypothetical protein ACO2PN_05830 [Pyrobaculum sp.]
MVLVPPLWVRRRPRLTGGLGGGRRFLSLSAAGWRRWFKSEDAAEHPRPPLRRNSGETAEDGRWAETRRAFGYWRRCLGTRASSGAVDPASRLRGRGGQPESETHQVCKDRCVSCSN